MTPSLAGVPTRIETRRLVLRAFEAADAEAFDALVMSSIDHLLPWQPWAADEPHPMDQRRRDLGALGEQLRAGSEAHYAITYAGDGMLLGSAALVPGASAGCIEVGYWLGVTHTGCGYATEAARVLTHVGLATLGLPRLEIWADEANDASNAVARRAGYAFESTQQSYLDDAGEPPLMNVWVADGGWLAR
ncbi:GNAT family N-acetyltransferase [Demequina sp. NBRC 110053]|uniref:GNAT family N-acetyltransferase n=1 Tax=Demequina sp. NBRC 110053 TaxID=1570342 RepID=UPI000A068EBF|nr:GNAT family protein [Demequina sp. NBRC 110053]